MSETLQIEGNICSPYYFLDFFILQNNVDDIEWFNSSKVSKKTSIQLWFWFFFKVAVWAKNRNVLKEKENRSGGGGGKINYCTLLATKTCCAQLIELEPTLMGTGLSNLISATSLMRSLGP